MNRLLTWAKNHKVAAGAAGCGSLIVLAIIGFTILVIILVATGNADVETGASETTEAAAPAATTSEEVPPESEPAPEPTVEPSEEPAETTPPAPEDPLEAFKASLPDLDGLDVSEGDGALLVGFEANPDFDNLDKDATLDIIKAANDYRGDYDYLMVSGSEPTGIWSYSYDRDTVKAIAEGSPVVDDIWELADRSFDPR